MVCVCVGGSGGILGKECVVGVRDGQRVNDQNLACLLAWTSQVPWSKERFLSSGSKGVIRLVGSVAKSLTIPRGTMTCI